MKSAMTSSPLRVAIIGAGQVADKVHASYYCTRNDLELVAVCDSRLSQAQALAEKYGNASVWDDPQAMLLAVKPDVVSVCSPNRFHYEHTLMALEAGCHVMCEKPPAMTPEQAREMCDTARKLGKVLAYDFHHRFALDTQQLREQVTNGVLEEIYVTTARALRRCGVPGWGVFTNKELQGGGPLIDIGIHMLDAAMYVLGFPAVKSVNAHSFQKIGTQKSCGQFGEWDPATYSVEDSLFGTIEFHNGGILWLETSFALNIREQSIMNVSFCGDKADATGNGRRQPPFAQHGSLYQSRTGQARDDSRRRAGVHHPATGGGVVSIRRNRDACGIMTRPVTLSEPHFSQHTLNKYASLMAQGNGYLGLRASHEEDYTRQT